MVMTSLSQVYMTKEKALKHFLPGATPERRTLFLTDEQVGDIERHSKVRVESKVITYYVGKAPHGGLGYAFFDTHNVRTMPETFMVLINPDSTIATVEILAFYEPEDYLPGARWRSLFAQRKLNDDLWVKRGIPNISGATLSAQAITGAVRRLLATFEIAVPKED
jgi:hypothetical protein